MELNPRFTKEVISSGRTAKEEALEQQLDFSGGTSDIYKDTIPHKISSLIDISVEKHYGWIEDKLKDINAKLPDKSKIFFEDVLKIFKATFEKRIKQQAKLSKEKPEIYINTINLEEIFNQAIFDFIQSLKSSVRNGETKKNILKLGELSHWLNPNDIKDLERQFSNTDQGVIKTAVLSRPKNPKVFIGEYNDRVFDLVNKYPDIDQDRKSVV